MGPTPPDRLFAYLEREPDSCAAFLGELRNHGQIEVYPTLEALLHAYDERRHHALLFDFNAMMDAPTSLIAQLHELRNEVPMGLVTGGPIEDHFSEIRRLGITRVAVKAEPVQATEVGLFVDTLLDRQSISGLMRYLHRDVELYSVNIRSIPEKVDAIERATNHFATCGFEVHDLYDVRLSLEEMTNNALFHGFQTATGEEKYNIRSFQHLADDEIVRIEYGSDGICAGFSVMDNAGTLSVKTVLAKLERQYNKEGLYDDSGRGLYLTRMLSSMMLVNIQPARRTQIMVLFDAVRKTDRPKPLLVNCNGPDHFSEWRLDPDFD